MPKPSRLFLTVGLALFAGCVQADSFVTAVIINDNGFKGPIQSWSLDLTTGAFTAVGSFMPQGNGPSPNGRGIAVTNTQSYYTVLTNNLGPTLSVETGLYNGGAGGPDNGSIPNPLPGAGIAALHFGNGPTGGDLYALVGYPSQGPFVYVLDPTTGMIISPVVQLATDPSADGFTILPNGNYLVNEGGGLHLYDQYSPLTGARIPGTTISSGCLTSPNGVLSTGVDTDGTHLFFDCTFKASPMSLPIGIRETDLSGALIHDFNVQGASGEGLSLVENFSPPPPNVPEPASVVLLGTAAVLLGLKLRKTS